MVDFDRESVLSRCRLFGVLRCIPEFVCGIFADVPGHTMQQVIQGLCVDAIGRQLGVLYIIDDDGDICYRGNHNLSSTGTINIKTTPYAF